MAFDGPLTDVPALIFAKLNAPVPVLTLTACPVVEVTVPNEKFVEPLLATVTAVPPAVVTLPNDAVEALVVALKFTPAPAFVTLTVMLPNENVPLELVMRTQA